MPHRLVKNRLTFLLERLVLRGPQYRLLMIAALIGLISVSAGAIVMAFDPQFRDASFGTAVWWSFLRLTDPGYLGDDSGTLERLVSTILTVLGYVLFLGALIAIMTQWMNERMHELEAGLTPIAQRDHVVIIGWTSRTPVIVMELMLSGGRVKRFLERRGARSLRIAILADEVTTALGVELRDRLGSLWNESQVILRTGSALRLEHLRRVDFQRAAALIIPADDYDEDGNSAADTRTIKTLLSMRSQHLDNLEPLPLAVVEIFDSRKIDVARNAYGGAIEILASDAIISRLVAQNVRQPGLSHVYGEVLTHGRGSEIYVRDAGPVVGMRFGTLHSRYPRAILLGVVRQEGDTFTSLLNPAADFVVAEGDRLALLAHSYDATSTQDGSRRAESGHAAATAADTLHAAAEAPAPPHVAAADGTSHAARTTRVLVLGWSHKVPALLQQFDSFDGERYDVHVLSSSPLAVRREALERFGFTPRTLELQMTEADFALPGVLERADVMSYDSIVMLGSDRTASGEEADARTIVGSLLLRELLPESGGPHVLVELLDPGNAALFRHRQGEVLLSPLLLSHMLAQVALRRELIAVFDELFGAEGSGIGFESIEDYDLDGRELTFRDVADAARTRGRIALGVRTAAARGAIAGGVALNPLQDTVYSLQPGDQLVVLT